jgi:transposase
MHDTEFNIRARRKWVELYAATKNAALVCRRCGICAPTLRKWWRRYQAEGEAGLHSRSNCPHHSLGRKLTDEHIGWIIEMRSKRNLGPRRIQAELIRLHAFKLSTATIWKVLDRHGMNRLRSGHAPRQPKLYSRDVPGERTLEGVESLHMMRKGQVKRLDGRDAVGQARFVQSLFGVAA